MSWISAAEQGSFAGIEREYPRRVFHLHPQDRRRRDQRWYPAKD